MTPPRSDARLAWLLRAIGGTLLLALPTVFLPPTAMNAVHRDVLALGPLPDGVLVQYLSRTASLLYALHGAVMLFVSFDVPRYRPLIRLLGVTNALFGAACCGVDLVFGMPLWWAAWEGPLIVTAGVATCYLARCGSAEARDFAHVS